MFFTCMYIVEVNSGKKLEPKNGFLKPSIHFCILALKYPASKNVFVKFNVKLEAI